MTDRRRINGPPSGTTAPVFARTLHDPASLAQKRPTRTRGPDELRKIFLKTGLTPSAAGSAYLELQQPTTSSSQAKAPSHDFQFLSKQPSLKLVATVHGPLPLPRSQPFTPHLQLTTHVKFAPFATRKRRGYVRDHSERDLGQHLETALRGAIIGDRWIKCSFAITVTVLEGEEDRWWFEHVGRSNEGGPAGSWGLMAVLAGCITVASAAVVDAGIDCVGLLAGGFAGIIRPATSSGVVAKTKSKDGEKPHFVLDPCPIEHDDLQAACVVAYLEERDEITEIWMQGTGGKEVQDLVDRAVEAAVITKKVLAEAVTEGAIAKFPELTEKNPTGDVEMGD